MTEIAATSVSVVKGICWRLSSKNSTSTSGGSAAANTTGPCGGRWNSVCRSSFGQEG